MTSYSALTAPILSKWAKPVPRASLAGELGLDVQALELERPTEWFQVQLAALHTERAQAFADFSRHRETNKAFVAEIIAWERYCLLTRLVCDMTGAKLPAGILVRKESQRKTLRVAILRNICSRCGFIWTLRQPRLIDGLCSSCLALQEKVLRRGRLACQPWQGRFAADDVTPVSAAGLPILPGARYCGSSDCVNPKHITKGKKNV